MAIPTASELVTLDFAFLGLPFCNIESKSGQDTQTLDFAYLGLPWFGASAGGAPPPPTYVASQFFMVF